MYTVIIFAIMGFILGWVYEFRNYGDPFEGIGLGLVCACLGLVTGFVIAWAVPVHYKDSQWETPIVSLKDNNSIRGSFFLGSGVVDGQMKYVYYMQSADSSFRLVQVKHSKAAIKYSNSPAKLLVFDRSEDDCLWNKFVVDLDNEDDQTYMFYIPRGSIQEGFDLDLQ